MWPVLSSLFEVCSLCSFLTCFQLLYLLTLESEDRLKLTCTLNAQVSSSHVTFLRHVLTASLTPRGVRTGVGAAWCQHRRCSECEAGVWNVPREDVQCDISPEHHIEILLLPQTERRDVMNAPSCFRHKCSHRLLQHVRQHLTQMCLRDGSSFFPLISFFVFSIC